MLFFVAILLFALIVVAFFVIARKGRRLRTSHVLPDEASHARLESGNGKGYTIESQAHFYLGSHPECHVVLSRVTQEYAVCIFYHRRRFAFQTYSGSRGIRVNGDEQMAGYLTNGDVLEIADETFTFRSF